MNPFTAHPASVGESYTQHWMVATRFGRVGLGSPD